ncbi:hypothetical protein [Actinoplanes teichomyceticus]|uniref:Flagellar biosynthesis protein FlgA n=1 Tax=Actinoplanes teichomyceticus TaxID=1867 RepID=A0A561WPU2_ACTTI|nr:hypothetical protein [Actinoplanes teichomyceticus]TWG25886.1 hypothetical protein FHX34_101860 [Actinoplanes teichomyceticus]GIF10961.1 hypothetical protein Ate01nite_09930 [Actinoplanes teichomyceticus]
MGGSGDHNERLDPVRWRPGRGRLLRLGAVAILLATAAGLIWSRPAAEPCPAPAALGDPIQTIAASGLPATPGASGRPPIPDGTVGVPVRLADPTALALIHPGNRVDLLRLDDEGAGAPVARAALVLDVTGADDPTVGGLLLALDPGQAARAVSAPERGFAVLIRPG